MMWRSLLPGWPVRAPMDVRLLDQRVASHLDPSPTSFWEEEAPAGWTIRAAVAVPSAHPDLSEPDLRPVLDQVESHFGAVARRAARAPLGSEVVASEGLLLSCDTGTLGERLALADWLWTLEVRRLEHLREHGPAEADLSHHDLADLDELAETIHHHRRARIERGASDGSGMLLAFWRVRGGRVDASSDVSC